MSRSRVFENHEFEAVAAKATKAAKEDVMKRFYIPINGTLRCKYMGTQKSDDKDLILFYTKVVFKWEHSSPRVKGSVDLVICCCFFRLLLCVFRAAAHVCLVIRGRMVDSRKLSSEHRKREHVGTEHEQAIIGTNEGATEQQEAATLSYKQGAGSARRFARRGRSTCRSISHEAASRNQLLLREDRHRASAACDGIERLRQSENWNPCDRHVQAAY